MTHEQPKLFLPRSDGTHDVFCEASYRRVRPCNGYAKLTPDGTLVRGSILYDPGKQPRYFCGHHCLAWFVKGA